MGWELGKWTVYVNLDSHGGEKEELHQRLWEEIQAALVDVISRPEYNEIRPESYSNCNKPFKQ